MAGSADLQNGHPLSRAAVVVARVRLAMTLRARSIRRAGLTCSSAYTAWSGRRRRGRRCLRRLAPLRLSMPRRLPVEGTAYMLQVRVRRCGWAERGANQFVQRGRQVAMGTKEQGRASRWKRSSNARAWKGPAMLEEVRRVWLCASSGWWLTVSFTCRSILDKCRARYFCAVASTRTGTNDPSRQLEPPCRSHLPESV